MLKIFNRQKGNNNTQIGQQIIGLSPEDATKMAFTIFKEYYPKLRDEALTELKRLVSEKLYNVPENCIDPPNPRIAVPVLQNASITEEQEIRELYANLLANSMNKIVKNGVHPGFVEIIKQLSPDEAKILSYMGLHGTIPIITLRYVNNEGGGIDIIRNFSNVGELTGCETPQDIAKYFDNLVRLGLIENSGGLSSLTDKTKYEPLKTHKLIAPHATVEKAKAHGFDKIDFEEGLVKISSYGDSFCSICLDTHQVIIISSQENGE